MIYYAEDDEAIRELVVYTLRRSGLDAEGLPDGQKLLTACRERKPDLILLDIMMPGRDGLSILKQLKADAALRRIPVVMITARGSEYDRVVGLDLGADDYICKPFGIMELVARVRARLRAAADGNVPSVLECGGIVLDSRSHAVTADGERLMLTPKEFALLELLLSNPGNVYSREQILERIWDYSYEGGTRTVDVHIQTLRVKLGRCGEMIKTVRSVGYKLEA